MTELKKFCIDAVRQHFPAFDNQLERGLQSNTPSTECFFENAGGTFPTRHVLRRLNEFYANYKVQPYGATPLQEAAGNAMDSGRQRMADVLGLDVDDMIIGPSTTQNFNTLSIGFSGLLESGDEIILSEQDHEANIGGWLRAAKLAGAEVRFWLANANTGQLQLDDLASLVNAKTRLVSVTHSSNIIGSINPLTEIATLLDGAAKQRIYLIADGVSYAPHGLPDITALSESGVDAYSFSTYKTFGTHLGIMYVKPELSELLTPQCHYFNTGKRRYRFDSAGPDHASIAALAGIADYFDALYEQLGGNASVATNVRVQELSKLIKSYEQTLIEPVFNCLAGKKIRILGSDKADEKREANIAFHTEGMTSAKVNQQLASHGIAAGNGDFYAPRVLTRMGIEDLEDGVVRLSFAHYNSEAEVAKLTDALNAILPAN